MHKVATGHNLVKLHQISKGNGLDSQSKPYFSQWSEHFGLIEKLKENLKNYTNGILHFLPKLSS